jgi:competence protein ComEA
MRKFLLILQWILPFTIVAGSLLFAWPAADALVRSSRSLECFCPSCPETAFAAQGVDQLGLLRIDVQGAVKKPGIYQLEVGKRIADAIDAAGGLHKEADSLYLAKTLNLATKIKDADKLYIPFTSERELAQATGAAVSNGGGSGVAPPAGGATSSPTSSALISINNATLAQLQTLSGIGEARAQKIVDARPYAQLSELVSKGALGQSLFDSLVTQLSL